MAPEQTILVTSTIGHIGLELTPLLLKGNAKLVFATSNDSRLQSTFPALPKSRNATIEEGSIKHPQWVEAIIKKHAVTAVSITITGGDELLLTLNFFDAMKRAGGIKHLIMISGAGSYVEQADVAMLTRVCSAEHVLVKATLEQKLAYAGFPWTTTILGPTLFFTNDLRSKPSMIKDKFFDESLSEKDGKKVMTGSLRQYRASETAQYWSKALGREISFIDPSDGKRMLAAEDRISTVAQYVSGVGSDTTQACGRDVVLMYETFADYGFGMSEEDHALRVELLGKEPEGYEKWVSNQGDDPEVPWKY